MAHVRGHLRLRGWFLIIVLCCLSVGCAREQDRVLFRGTIPRDLPRRLGQLKKLQLSGPVDNLSWLTLGLRDLKVRGTSITSLQGLPRSLYSLDASNNSITRFQGTLPDSLEVLDLSWTKIHEIEGLPVGLRSLALAGPSVQRLRGLPGSLVSLSLTDTDLPDLSGLPESLESLVLSGPSFERLEGMPPALKSLALVGTRIKILGELPETLQSLTLINNGDLISEPDLPPFLSSLTIDLQRVPSLKSLRYINTLNVSRSQIIDDHLPDSLSTLRLNEVNAPILAAFPASLRKLEIVAGSLDDLPALPSHIESLRMKWVQGQTFEKIPPSLKELDVSWSELSSFELPEFLSSLETLNVSATGISEMEDLQGIQKLKTLQIRWSKISTITELPASLTSFDATGSKDLSRLGKLPGSLRVLRIQQTAIEQLPNLPSSLREIDFSNTKINSLKGLKEGLEVLTLHAGQVDTLEGLPSTVRVLYFVEKISGADLLGSAAR